MRHILVKMGALAAAASLCLAGCGNAGPSASSANGGAPVRIKNLGPKSPYRGTELSAPLAKPDLVLTSTSGKPFDLRSDTAGKLTLLYFGYTHCPDVCPTTMADLARALTMITPQDRAKVTVVFVTSDPDRDTPSELHSWLSAFDPSFIGLTGPFDKIQAAAKSVGVAIEPAKVDANGHVTVTHGAQVIAFSPDGLARVVFLGNGGSNPNVQGAGPTNGYIGDDYAHDIPLLLHQNGATP